MGKYVKYLSFLAITLLFSIKNVYASTLTKINYTDSTKIKDVDLNVNTNFRGDNIVITEVGTNQVNICVNNNCYLNTLPSTIKINNLNRYFYEIFYKENTNEYYFVYANGITTITNEWGGFPAGDEYITQGTQATLYQFNSIRGTNSDYLNSSGALYQKYACWPNPSNICRQNILMGGNWQNYVIYNINNNTFTGINNNSFVGDGTNYNLIHSNTTIMICKSSNCQWNYTSFTNGTDWDFYSFQESTNTITYIEKNDIWWSEDIKSLDLFYMVATQDKYKITITPGDTNGEYSQTKSTPTNYKFYGRKCDNIKYNTCYWEEVEQNNNSSVSNINYDYSENKTEITFDLNIDTTNYQEIKLSIIMNPKNFRIKLENKDDTNFYLDLNTIGSKYSLTIDQTIYEVNGIYVNSKSGSNKTYRFYVKRDEEYGITTFYNFEKESKIVNDSIETSIFNSGFFRIHKRDNNDTCSNTNIGGSIDCFGNLYLETGIIQLGTNTPNALYIADYHESTNNIITYIYFSDEVYYSTTNDFTLSINYGDTHEDIDYNVTNQYLQNAFNNISKVNIQSMIELINKYESYKDQWLSFFDSIWLPIPDILKDIIVLQYFMLHCYGIYLIFKD